MNVINNLPVSQQSNYDINRCLYHMFYNRGKVPLIIKSIRYFRKKTENTVAKRKNKYRIVPLFVIGRAQHIFYNKIQLLLTASLNQYLKTV